MLKLLQISTMLFVLSGTVYGDVATKEAPTNEQSKQSLGEPKIDYSLKEDGRNWVVGMESKDKDGAVTEYVPANEDKKNWKEHIIVQYRNNVKVEPENLFNEFIKQIKASLPSHQIEYRIIKKSPDSLTAEWWMHDQTPDAQHEWMKIFVDGQNVAFLRYANRRWEQTESFRKVWEKILDDAKLTHVNAPQPAK